jgi:hypothetical protein
LCRALPVYYRKHGFKATLKVVLLGSSAVAYERPTWDSAVFQYAKFRDDRLVVDGFVPVSERLPAPSVAFAVVGANGAVFAAQRTFVSQFLYDGAVLTGHRFRFVMEAAMPPGLYACVATCDGQQHRLRSVAGIHFPLVPKYRLAYMRAGRDVIVRLSKDGNFALCPGSRLRRATAECAFCLELLLTPSLAGVLAVFLRTAARCLRAIHPGRIWIFSDKLGNPCDSAYAVAQALMKRPDFAAEKISAYYVVARDEPRRREIACHIPVLKHLSLKHYLYYLLAAVNVTSEGGYNPFTPRTAPYQDMLARQLRVWSGHGIIHHDLTAIYGKDYQNFHLLALGVAREREYLLGGLWGYDPEELVQTGLARWDFRVNRPRRKIYFIFTWRAALVVDIDERTHHRRYGPSFGESLFCRRINELLSSHALREVAARNGYDLCFVPHPLVLPAMAYFRFPQYVEVVVPGAPHGKTYDDIYAEASLLVTDYSSVAMDMAYMGKPVVYYQFDRAEFYASQGYTPAFFSWEDDGFGEVLHDQEALIARISAYVENGCTRGEKYERRAAAFFPPRDRDNGYRTCRAILAALKARAG